MLDTLDVALSFAAVMLALSLIIMSMTQAIASVLALRGARLHRGIKELIQQAAPTLAARIEGRAVTVDAFVDAVLRHGLISDSAVTRSGRWGWATAIKREELVPVINAVLAQSGLPALVAEEVARLESWFDSFMTRVSQWFAMNTRWITIALAAILAVALHLDALDLVKTIQADKELRARLEGMAGSLLDQTPEEVDKLEVVYSETLKAFVAAHAPKFRQPNDAGGTGMRSRRDAADWIAANATDPASVPDLVALHDDALDDALESGLQRSIDRATTLRRSLTTAGLSLSTPTSPGGSWMLPDLVKWPGIIASVLLLSLGAPFWFNVLKSLTSLKSAVTHEAPQTQSGASVMRARAAAMGSTTDGPRLHELV